MSFLQLIVYELILAGLYYDTLVCLTGCQPCHGTYLLMMVFQLLQNSLQRVDANVHHYPRDNQY